MATPLQIGIWAYDAGWRSLGELTEAIALAAAHRGSETTEGGLWGLGGPTGDGAAQARHAYEVYVRDGRSWTSFPARESVLLPLVRPGAAATAGVVMTFRRGAEAVDRLPGPGDVADLVREPLETVAEAADTARRIGNFLTEPSTWVRAAKIAGGLLMIASALAVVLQQELRQETKQLLGVATKVVTKKGGPKRGASAGSAGAAAGGGSVATGG